MPMLQRAAAAQPRYQTIRGARYNPRCLTPWQPALLTLCQTPMTLAELVEATRLPTSELSRILKDFCEHALMKLVIPAWSGTGAGDGPARGGGATRDTARVQGLQDHSRQE